MEIKLNIFSYGIGKSISYKPVYHDGLTNYHEHTKCLNVSLYNATFIVCFLHVNSLILYDSKKNLYFKRTVSNSTRSLGLYAVYLLIDPQPEDSV